MTRIGLLKCGSIRADLSPEHGDYPELFGDLLRSHGIEITTYDVEHGTFPASAEERDGWLVSGSASSVYEPLDWIDRTRDLLGEIVASERPLVAVCFGHQLLAQALGGEVTRSERGWGVGVQRYEVVSPLPNLPADVEAPHELSLIASHQDQVTRAPESVTVLATSQHCPVAAYSYGDRVIAVQAHPEFTPALSRDLIEARHDVIGARRADHGLASLDQPTDEDLVSTWFAATLAP